MSEEPWKGLQGTVADQTPIESAAVILWRLDRLDKAVAAVRADIKALGTHLETIITILEMAASAESAEPAPLASYGQLYEAQEPQSGGWRRLFPRRSQHAGSTASTARPDHDQ